LGTGLFISKSIINAHCGKICDKNNYPEGKGAMFGFSLPLAVRRVTYSIASISANSDNTKPRECILISLSFVYVVYENIYPLIHDKGDKHCDFYQTNLYYYHLKKVSNH
jgi:hypothetical protein